MRGNRERSGSKGWAGRDTRGGGSGASDRRVVVIKCKGVSDRRSGNRGSVGG